MGPTGTGLSAVFALAVAIGGSGSPPHVCERGGWCARGPLEVFLSGLWSAAPDDVWAVGMRGTVLHFDGHQWTSLDAARNEDLESVWGSGPRDVWAVGSRRSEKNRPGGVFHWDGQAWSRFASVEGARAIAVRGTGPGDVWVAQEDGTLTHWDGQRFGAPIPGPGPARATRLRAIGLSEAAPGELWLATETGLWRHDAGGWSNVKSPARRVAAVLAPGRDELWVADRQGKVHHRDAGGTWQSWRVGAPKRSVALAGSGGTIWYASGPSIYRWDGGRWSETPRDGPASDIYALELGSAGHAWAAGEHGALLEWRDEKWIPAGDPGGPTNGNAIWGSADDDVWVAQSSPTALAHWNGSLWTTTTQPDIGTLRALWGTAPDDVWAVGDVILHWDGHGWSRSPALLWFRLFQIWGSGPDDVWASGADGVIHWDGCQWQAAQTRRDGMFNAGAAVGPNEAFVLRPKSVQRWDGQRWTDDSLPGHQPAAAIWGGPSTGVFAVNGFGTYRSNGGGWTRIGPSPGSGMARLFGLGAETLWSRAENGTLARWDGRKWVVDAAPFQMGGRSLWVSPTGVAWISGWMSGIASGPPAATAAGPPVAPGRRAARRCVAAPDLIAPALAHAKDALRPGQSRPSAVAALNTVQDWLEGVREGDPVRIAERSALPFGVEGLTTEYGPRWRMCGGPPRPDALEGTHAFYDPGMTLQVADEAAFRDLLACVLGDAMLADTIPRGSLDQRDAGGREARIDVITVSQLSPRLARFKSELAAVAPTSVLVQSTSTDNDGITVAAAFVVAGDDATCRVTKVYLDEQFEE